MPKLLSSASDLVDLSPLGHSPFWVHFTRGDGHWSVRIDQAQNSSHWICIPSISPGSTKSTSVDPRRSPCSQMIFYSTVSASTWRTSLPALMPRYSVILYLVLQSTHIQYSAALLVHQSCKEAQSHGQARMTFFRDAVKLSHTTLVAQGLKLEDPMQAIRLAAFFSGQVCDSPFGFPLQYWNASKFASNHIHDHIGKRMWRTPNGLNF
jgi:hypothetical protein